MVFSLIVPAAALEAGDMALHRADAGESGAAFAAGIKVSPLETNAFQGKVVAPGLVRYAEILAGLAPFDPVGRNLTATDAMLGQKVGELMAQGALDLGG
jgi:hypothetical protein